MNTLQNLRTKFIEYNENNKSLWYYSIKLYLTLLSRITYINNSMMRKSFHYFTGFNFRFYCYSAKNLLLLQKILRSFFNVSIEIWWNNSTLINFHAKSFPRKSSIQRSRKRVFQSFLPEDAYKHTHTHTPDLGKNKYTFASVIR